MFKLMIVEDEKRIREGLASGFDWESLGFRISNTAMNGVEALSCYKSNTPDVIMTDIRMPVMDGFELMDRIHRENEKIKFIVLSGYDSFEYARKSIHFGVTSYLLKPVSENELYPLMRQIYHDLDLQRKKTDEERRNSLIINQSKHEIMDIQFRKLLHGNYVGQNTAIQLMMDIMPEINPSRMSIGLISFKNPFHTNSVYNYLVTSDTNKYQHFVIDGDLIICLISALDKSSPDQEAMMIQAIYNDLKNGYPDKTIWENLVITLSRPCSDISTIQNTYREALDLLKHSFYNIPGKAIQARQIQKTKELPQNAVIASALASAIEEENENDMIFKLKEFIQSCSLQYLPKDILMFKCTEIYVMTSKKLENIRVHYEDEKYIFERFREITEVNSFIKHADTLFRELYQCNKQSKILAAQSIIQKVESYILKNYEKDLSLNSLSEIFHINASYLSTLFCKKTNVPLTNYIRNVRIEKAKILLSSSEHSINEVARLVGFKEYRHFCTVFKSEVGSTPKSFRFNSYVNN